MCIIGRIVCFFFWRSLLLYHKRQDRGRWVGIPKGADGMAIFGLSCRNTLVGSGGPLLSSMYEQVEKTVFLPCTAPILTSLLLS